MTSSGTSSAANGRAGEEYQVRARYQVRATALLEGMVRHGAVTVDPPGRVYRGQKTTVPVVL